MSEDGEDLRSAAASEGEWLTTGEAAQILGVSLPTVRRMADNGTLVARRNPSWSSLGEDRHGRPLRGHRSVSRKSVLAVKAKHEAEERAAAEAVARNPVT